MTIEAAKGPRTLEGLKIEADMKVKKKYGCISNVLATTAVMGILGGYLTTAFSPAIARAVTPKPTLPTVEYVRQPLERALEVYALDNEYQEAITSNARKITWTGLGVCALGMALMPLSESVRRRKKEELLNIEENYRRAKQRGRI